MLSLKLRAKSLSVEGGWAERAGKALAQDEAPGAEVEEAQDKVEVIQPLPGRQRVVRRLLRRQPDVVGAAVAGLPDRGLGGAVRTRLRLCRRHYQAQQEQRADGGPVEGGNEVGQEQPAVGSRDIPGLPRNWWNGLSDTDGSVRTCAGVGAGTQRRIISPSPSASAEPGPIQGFGAAVSGPVGLVTQAPQLAGDSRQAEHDQDVITQMQSIALGDGCCGELGQPHSVDDPVHFFSGQPAENRFPH